MMNPQSNGPDAKYIKNLFGSISSTYDKANDVITFGLARQWRRRLVEWSGVQADSQKFANALQISNGADGLRILDCATGTGDLALEFKKVVGSHGRVVGSDFCREMLEVAPAKAARFHLDVTFEIADVLALPYADHAFDITSIAYGIRNVADVHRAIRELARVTKSGGRVMILETGSVNSRILRPAIRFYFEKVVPRLGGWVSGKPEAYQYLQKSSGDFPSGTEFCKILQASGCFIDVEHISLMAGASFIYKATVK